MQVGEIFRLECISVPRDVCEAAARVLERVEELARVLCPEYIDVLRQIRERITIYMLPSMNPEELRGSHPWLAEIVAKMKESGFRGVATGNAAVVLVYPGEFEEAVESVAEEALHILMQNMWSARYIEEFRPTGPLEEWLAEELLVHELLYRLGIVTERELEEMQRAYMEVYEREAGRPAPREYLEKARRLAEKIIAKMHEGVRA